MCLFVVSCLLEQRAKQMSQREKPSQVEQTSEVPRRLDTEAEEHQQHASRDHRQVKGTRHKEHALHLVKLADALGNAVISLAPLGRNFHFDQRRYENERNERPMGERYLHNQHIKAVIIDVRDPNSNLQPVRGEHSRPPIVISRTHPELMRRLFEQEVPEIYEGTVQIKSIAREPGQRSKVAVHSLDDRLDPVGACVGPKGSRVRAVVGELRGERVDVILWDADPAVYVANALSPAKVTRVLIDEEKAYAGVIVPDDQLSLAIGKEGQNARLAARLTGWHIDIKSETLAADILKNVPVHEEPAADLIGDEEDEDVRRCEYVSEDGIQCRNQARPGSRFCGVHDTDAFDDAEDLI